MNTLHSHSSYPSDTPPYTPIFHQKRSKLHCRFSALAWNRLHTCFRHSRCTFRSLLGGRWRIRLCKCRRWRSIIRLCRVLGRFWTSRRRCRRLISGGSRCHRGVLPTISHRSIRRKEHPLWQAAIGRTNRTALCHVSYFSRNCRYRHCHSDKFPLHGHSCYYPRNSPNKFSPYHQ